MGGPEHAEGRRLGSWPKEFQCLKSHHENELRCHFGSKLIFPLPHSLIHQSGDPVPYADRGRSVSSSRFTKQADG